MSSNYYKIGPVCRYELETDDHTFESERKERMEKRKMRFRIDELKSMKISQIRNISTILAVDIHDCIDKQEVIDRLLQSGRIEITEGAPAILHKKSHFHALGVGELRRLLLSFGLSDAGALEKNELRSRLIESGRVIVEDDEEFDQTENTKMTYTEDVGDVKSNSSDIVMNSNRTSDSWKGNDIASENLVNLLNLSVSELKQIAIEKNIDISNCLYKEDLVAKLMESSTIVGEVL